MMKRRFRSILSFYKYKLLLFCLIRSNEKFFKNKRTFYFRFFRRYALPNCVNFLLINYFFHFSLNNKAIMQLNIL